MGSPVMTTENTRPIPDPTELTTEALTREITALRELLYSEIRHRNDLTNEQFKSISREINIRFDAVEQRTAEQKTDTRLALEAALAAAKDAVQLQTEASELAQSKSEAAFTKQIDAILMRVEQSYAALAEQIGDVKGRLDKLEGNRSGISSTIGMLLAVAVAAVAVVALILNNID